MSDHKHNEQDYIESWDTGTYQTGSIKAPKGSSGLVAVLLVAVIFLGGLVSALGILNIRLLDQLTQEPGATMPMSKDSQPQTHSSTSPFQNNLDPVPVIPVGHIVDLQLMDVPLYSQNPDDVKVLSASQVYQGNACSMVEIHCLTHFNSTLTGIGLVLTQDGYLLTNAHVVDSASQIFVSFSDGSMARAALVGSDPFTDLAVLYVPVQGLTPAVFSSTRDMQVMDPTYAVEQLAGEDCDYVLRESSIYSTGHTLSTTKHALTLIQTFHGGEMGPVFNSRGQVVGFQVGRISQYFDIRETRGLGMVIPSAFIRNIVKELTENGYVSNRPALGMEIEPISKLYQHYWDLPGGMMLTHIKADSSAALAGLQEGDILLALDGQPMNDRDKLYAFLYHRQVGDEVIAVIFRNEQKFTVKLIIEKTEG